MDEESCLAEIFIGGGIWTNEVLPIGQSLDQVKVWAISQAQEGHAGLGVFFMKMQKFNKKFNQFVDAKNLSDQVKNDDRIRVILEVARLVNVAESQLLQVDVTGEDGMEATPSNSVSSARRNPSPKQRSFINCSPRGPAPPKILTDAGYTPNRNKLSAKYAKFFFGDNEAVDIDAVLSQTLDQKELENLLEQFTEEKYRDAKEHMENEKARKLLIRKCAHWLMANCNETDQPSVMEKSIMAYSIWCRFPFFASAPSDKNALPYTIIYDPLGYKGYLGNAIANKRQTKFGCSAGRKRKLDASVEGDQQEINNEDGELKEEEAKALKKVLQTMNL